MLLKKITKSISKNRAKLLHFNLQSRTHPFLYPCIIFVLCTEEKKFFLYHLSRSMIGRFFLRLEFKAIILETLGKCKACFQIRAIHFKLGFWIQLAKFRAFVICKKWLNLKKESKQRNEYYGNFQMSGMFEEVLKMQASACCCGVCLMVLLMDMMLCIS